MKDEYYRKAFVTHIIDGDTFEAIVDLGFYVSIKYRFRILGINTPELKGSTRNQGLIAKQFLADLILNKSILIQSTALDGFRRALTHVYLFTDDGEVQNVATLLINAGMAIPYNQSKS